MSEKESFSSPKGAIFCPSCQNDGRIHYMTIPESTREYSADGEQWKEYLGPSKDYTCFDCGTEWTMVEEV